MEKEIDKYFEMKLEEKGIENYNASVKDFINKSNELSEVFIDILNNIYKDLNINDKMKNYEEIKNYINSKIDIS